jgi:hypothetical protein
VVGLGLPSVGVELALQALPDHRQLAALHQAREHDIAVVAVAVLSRVPQPEDQQQAPAFRFKGTEEQAVAIRQAQVLEPAEAAQGPVRAKRLA